MEIKLEFFINELKEQLERGGIAVDEKDFAEFVAKLKEKVERKECIRCGECCYKFPCDFSPSDIGIIAKHLDMTAKEFFHKYLFAFDRVDNVISVLPIRAGMERLAGKRLHFLDSSVLHEEQCIFYDTELRGCKLHEIHKPSGAVSLKCWELKESQEFHFTENQLERLGCVERFMSSDVALMFNFERIIDSIGIILNEVKEEDELLFSLKSLLL